MTKDAEAPLGVFDSGLGGLTVVRALRQVLPNEDIVYLGDSARVPYGTKGADTVIKYAASCARHLLGQRVKAIVIACNTVSAVAIESMRIDLDLPVLGVIEPGARAAVGASKTGRIGVLATPGTIFSQAYTRAVTTLSTRTEVFGQAAPLLVPLAEEGWTDGDVPRLAARRYLEPLARAGVDVIVLGCTHYPLFFSVIEEEAKKMMGDHVRIVDSASTVAAETRDYFQTRDLLAAPRPRAGKIRLFVTDVPRSFSDMARRFLGDEDVPEAEQVDL
ncbi:glutamate racemase [Pendulispora albinea]|uniref:Glutamate racemase n=1 Tax=Pendulispora albinea TaxID=2741071 RepID=A0ABZ2LL44_9BACT